MSLCNTFFTEGVQESTGGGDQGEGNVGFGHRYARLHEGQERH